MTRTYTQIGPKKPIKDATEELVIPVLANFIKLGRVNDPLRCVLALAARAALRDKKLLSVQVLRHVSYLEFPNEVLRYRNDQLTAAMITVFDLSGKFTEGEYRFMPPPESWSIEAQRERAKKRAAEQKGKPKKPVKHRGPRMRPRGEHRVAWMQSAPKVKP